MDLLGGAGSAAVPGAVRRRPPGREVGPGHPQERRGRRGRRPHHHHVSVHRPQTADGHAGLSHLDAGWPSPGRPGPRGRGRDGGTGRRDGRRREVQGGLAQGPVGSGELDLVAGHPPRLPATSPPVGLPPTERVGDEPEVIAGPGGLAHRFLGTAGHPEGAGRRGHQPPRLGPAAPSRSRSATHSSVPSQGMLGWSQASQARRRPSGLGRGAAKKS